MDSRIKVLGVTNSYLNQIIYELREENVQRDRRRFRTNIVRLGMLMAYEISKDLEYEDQLVRTPLGELTMPLLKNQPVLVSVMRAGLPFHQGFLDLFDEADNGFIAAYRHHSKGNDFSIRMEYLACPSLEGRDVIVVDPMIATGSSVVLSCKSLMGLGKPRSLRVVGLIGSDQGVNHVIRQLPEAEVIVGAIDEELTAKAYIVPGLGDVGDLAYGEKAHL